MGSIDLSDGIRHRLREATEKSGLSQKEIARLVGIHPTTVNKYVKAEKCPSLDTFALLCKALSVSSDMILGLSPEKQ